MTMTNTKGLLVVLVTLFSVLMMNKAIAEEHVWKVADDVYRYGNPSHGYFSMFVVTDEGVIAIDPMNTLHAKGMLKAIKNITDKPVRYLLHSHNHWDHSKGGQVFRDQGAKIIAHKKAVEWMKGNPHPELVLPDEAWSGMRKDIVLGGKVIELHYLGMNHGLGMTAFVLPKENMAYIADIVTPNRMLFSIADFNFKEWTRTLTKLETMNFQQAIFSHSHAKQATGTKKDIIQTREFIEDLQAAILAEFKKGTSFYAMPTTLKLPKYEHWDFYNEWLSINIWNFMFQMEMGPFPWQPGNMQKVVQEHS
ncbi:MAG: MBL fold metallo-hydrolase [Gammaproteobacteria bacterium]